jgi:hypothetical protein
MAKMPASAAAGLRRSGAHRQQWRIAMALYNQRIAARREDFG